MKAAGPAALIAAEQAEDAGSECPYGRIEPGRGTDRVAHRHRERRGFDLEHVAGLRLDTLAERQRRGVEKMDVRSEEHTSELQSLMRISYAVFCLKKKKTRNQTSTSQTNNHTTKT